VAARPVHGFLLDGFHPNGPDSATIVFDTFQEALSESVVLLPPDKPRFYFGAAPPHLVFDLVAAGVDVFDSTYPNLVTERDGALVFPNTKFHERSEAVDGKPPYELDMADEALRMDLGPLVAQCPCHTCTSFSRAYVHHLVMTKEMLGRVLLSLHNLQHYQTFFLSLQSAIREDTVEQLRQTVTGRRHNPAG
jgi:tRNA-guanine family transglycosylase